jgi:transcriptional regulator with XRE-family HTH domain
MKALEVVRKNLLALWDAFEKAGGKQTELATRAGVKQGSVSMWLKAMRAGAVPKVDSLEALAKGFGVPIASLFPGSELGDVERRVLALLAPLDEVQKRELADELAELVKAYGPAAGTVATAQQDLRLKKKPRR